MIEDRAEGVLQDVLDVRRDEEAEEDEENALKAKGVE